MACALWCAVRRYSSATRLCGAPGTGYVSLRGLIGSRPVPCALMADGRWWRPGAVSGATRPR
eukprot:6940339-Prymnesium_polylepis.1